MFDRINNCYNTKDFRRLAKKRLPSPIFHYIDGAADDEVTYRRNTEAYEQCDLIPNVLAGFENIDMSTTVMGQMFDIPLYLAPTALQRLFHHDGEKAVGKAAEKFEKMVSALGGPRQILTSYQSDLPKASYIGKIIASKSGFIHSIQTRDLGLILIELGGGRKQINDKIY